MRHTAKDRLILALSTQLRAERQTREALAAALANGPLDREVMLAILGDPIPAFTQDDIAHAERLTRATPQLSALKDGALKVAALKDAA